MVWDGMKHLEGHKLTSIKNFINFQATYVIVTGAHFGFSVSPMTPNEAS